ncbi:MAG: hypothetical protein HY661_15745 [Betaproteobacteria bacterium]|nr:hypothetical protein [Betaproteobacteria bacterium]
MAADVAVQRFLREFMMNYGIPEWFRQENEKANIWNPPFDYSVAEVELSEFAAGLNNGWIESDVQTFLKSRPYLFGGLYRHGHGTYVFSELKFGGKYHELRIVD